MPVSTFAPQSARDGLAVAEHDQRSGRVIRFFATLLTLVAIGFFVVIGVNLLRHFTEGPSRVIIHENERLFPGFSTEHHNNPMLKEPKWRSGPRKTTTETYRAIETPTGKRRMIVE